MGMSREEAIMYLKRADVTVGKEIQTKTAEALDLAIKALEQEPIFDKIRAEIERQEKWLMVAGYNQYNVDIALDAIKLVVDKYKAETEDT